MKSKKGISVILLAIVQYSGIGITQLSGSIGGTTYARNGSTNYARNKTVGVNPNTAEQVIARQNFTDVVSSWRALTAAEQLAWDVEALNFPYVNSLSQVYFLSGFGLYSKFNMNLANIGEAFISAPSPAGTVAQLTLGTVEFDGPLGAGFFLDFLADPVAADSSLVVEMTRSFSLGARFTGRSMFKQVAVFAAGTGAPQDINAQYAAIFGAPVAGSKVRSRVSLINTVSGQRSAYVYSDTTI